MATVEWVPLSEAARFSCQRYATVRDAVLTRKLVSRRRANLRIEVTLASLLSYCDRLVEIGKLQKDEKNGKATYHPSE